MARRGGYSRDQPGIELVKTSLSAYGEAIRSSDDMHQDLYTWMNDAVAHHVYRCQMILGRERFAEASREAASAMRPSPLEADYMPRHTPPTITRPAGQGTAPGTRGPRP